MFAFQISLSATQFRGGDFRGSERKYHQIFYDVSSGRRNRFHTLKVFSGKRFGFGSNKENEKQKREIDSKWESCSLLYIDKLHTFLKTCPGPISGTTIHGLFQSYFVEISTDFREFRNKIESNKTDKLIAILWAIVNIHNITCRAKGKFSASERKFIESVKSVEDYRNYRKVKGAKLDGNLPEANVGGLNFFELEVLHNSVASMVERRNKECLTESEWDLIQAYIWEELQIVMQKTPILSLFHMGTSISNAEARARHPEVTAELLKRYLDLGSRTNKEMAFADVVRAYCLQQSRNEVFQDPLSAEYNKRWSMIQSALLAEISGMKTDRLVLSVGEKMSLIQSCSVWMKVVGLVPSDIDDLRKVLMLESETDAQEFLDELNFVIDEVNAAFLRSLDESKEVLYFLLEMNTKLSNLSTASSDFAMETAVFLCNAPEDTTAEGSLDRDKWTALDKIQLNSTQSKTLQELLNTIDYSAPNLYCNLDLLETGIDMTVYSGNNKFGFLFDTRDQKVCQTFMDLIQEEVEKKMTEYGKVLSVSNPVLDYDFEGLMARAVLVLFDVGVPRNYDETVLAQVARDLNLPDSIVNVVLEREDHQSTEEFHSDLFPVDSEPALLSEGEFELMAALSESPEFRRTEKTCVTLILEGWIVQQMQMYPQFNYSQEIIFLEQAIKSERGQLGVIGTVIFEHFVSLFGRPYTEWLQWLVVISTTPLLKKAFSVIVSPDSLGTRRSRLAIVLSILYAMGNIDGTEFDCSDPEMKQWLNLYCNDNTDIVKNETVRTLPGEPGMAKLRADYERKLSSVKRVEDFVRLRNPSEATRFLAAITNAAFKLYRPQQLPEKAPERADKPSKPLKEKKPVAELPAPAMAAQKAPENSWLDNGSVDSASVVEGAMDANGSSLREKAVELPLLEGAEQSSHVSESSGGEESEKQSLDGPGMAPEGKSGLKSNARTVSCPKCGVKRWKSTESVYYQRHVQHCAGPAAGKAKRLDLFEPRKIGLFGGESALEMQESSDIFPENNRPVKERERGAETTAARDKMGPTKVDRVQEPFGDYYYVLDTNVLMDKACREYIGDVCDCVTPSSAIRGRFVVPSLVFKELEILKFRKGGAVINGRVHTSEDSMKAANALKWYTDHLQKKTFGIYPASYEEYLPAHPTSANDQNDDGILGVAMYFHKKFPGRSYLITFDFNMKIKARSHCGLFVITHPFQIDILGSPRKSVPLS